jgi:hypothetical protein
MVNNIALAISNELEGKILNLWGENPKEVIHVQADMLNTLI